VLDIAHLVIGDVLAIIIGPGLAAIILRSGTGQPVLRVVLEVLLLAQGVILDSFHVAHVVIQVATVGG